MGNDKDIQAHISLKVPPPLGLNIGGEVGAICDPGQNLQVPPKIICVDLDGTLLKTDMLWECIVLCIRQSPQTFFQIPFWLMRGIGFAKHQLALNVQISYEHLPYREQVLDYLQQKKSEGAKIILSTASTLLIGEGIAAHLGIFDAVFASDRSVNLKGKKKAQKLNAAFGERKYVYVGDSHTDLAVWASAESAVVIGSPALCADAERLSPIELYIPKIPVSVSQVTTAFRIHHWSKNLLLFLPLLLAHKLTAGSWKAVLLGFVIFGLCASSAYLFNDILDLNSDRVHFWKASRPIASGRLSIRDGMVLMLLALSSALALGFLVLGTKFTVLIAGYWIVSNLYSSWLKRVPLLDVFVLAGFYVFRIVAGAVLADVTLSFWFVVFSGFFFLSLGTAKRCSELRHSTDLMRDNSGRGYLMEDREMLSAIGVASAFAAVIVLALYTNSPEVTSLYAQSHRLIFLSPILLLWTSRLWLKAHRGQLREDPIDWALRDTKSYVMAVGAILVILLSSPHPRL